MIIVNLKGGLGNQMFQYALGRKLALKNHVDLKLDISGYPRQTLRTYRLETFKINEKIATDKEIQRLKYPYGLLSLLWRFFSFKILHRFHIGWEPDILARLEKKKKFYLDGFWQSDKYFSEIAKIIRQDFSLKSPLSDLAQEITNKINSCLFPVSIHIRRGDYISNQKTNAYHGICDLSYYEKAIRYLEEKLSSPTFFIFSDDMSWVKKNLGLKNVVYVSQSGIPDYEELILMSLCHHHIIANSSFSWWGAWLDSRPDKIVVAPKIWFKGTNPKVYKNIIPESWIKV